MSLTLKFKIVSEQAMLELGFQLANACLDTALIFLKGQLGAGKTTFSRGFLRGRGFVGHVKSPTYTLVEPYILESGRVYHFDFYRLKDIHELEYIGIQDYFQPPAICVIEWPELGESVLPPADLSCDIQLTEEGRDVEITAHTVIGEDILRRFQYEQ